MAKNFRYGMSLFEIFQRAKYPVQVLKTQYRMHPEISLFPSKEFYPMEDGPDVKDQTKSSQSLLEGGPDVKDQTKRPWHVYRCFGPFFFFDFAGVESKPSGSRSWVNVDKVDFVLAMYGKLMNSYPELKSRSRLASISPYGDQVKLFRDCFCKTFGVEPDEQVDISTVDGFQDMVAGWAHQLLSPTSVTDVAIFSCVRASEHKGIGFLEDPQRMNVGLTRARSSVLVVGSASTLKQDTRWAKLVEGALERDWLKRDCFFEKWRPIE